MSDGGDLEPHEVDSLIRSLGYADARVEVRTESHTAQIAFAFACRYFLDLLFFYLWCFWNGVSFQNAQFIC